MSNKVTKAIDKKTLDIFVKLTRKQAKKEIIKKQDKLQRKLTTEEKKIIARKVARTTRGRAIVIGALALGSFSGAKATNLLNEANSKGIEQNKTEISIDAEQVDKDININNVTSDREIFVNGIKVDLEEITYSENIEERVTNEINSLGTPEEVLNYIKDVYVDEYNEVNNTNISSDNITLYKGRGEILEIDQADNGDKIVRSYEKSEYEGSGEPVQTDYGVVKVLVQDGDNRFVDEVSNYLGTGTYATVYRNDEKVEKSDSTVLIELGSIMDNGIDYYTALSHKDENSIEIINLYKERLINSVIEHEKSNIVERENDSSEGIEIND